MKFESEREWCHECILVNSGRCERSQRFRLAEHFCFDFQPYISSQVRKVLSLEDNGFSNQPPTGDRSVCPAEGGRDRDRAAARRVAPRATA